MLTSRSLSARKRRRSKCPHEALCNIRKHATSLYNVLVIGKTWSCSCWPQHTASLRLEPRPGRSQAPQGKNPQRISFRILLSMVCSQPGGQGLEADPASWHSREVDVKPFEISTDGGKVAEECPREPMNMSQGPPKKRIRFAHVNGSVACQPPPPPKPSLPSPKAIANICATLRKVGLPGTSLGQLCEDSPSKHQHHLYHADSFFHRTSNFRQHSLDKLLGDVAHQPQPQTLVLSRRERLDIALTLASSVLQLDSTRWLDEDWRSRDIVVYYDAITGDERPTPHLYLCWNLFPRGRQNSEINHVGAQGQSTKTLLALGLTLIELSLGKTLENMSVVCTFHDAAS